MGQETRNAKVSASVGTRIYAAIAITAALTVLATAVAFWSFAQIGETMRTLVEDRFPVVEISFELADAAAASVAIAPRLADAENLKALDEQMGLLASAEQRMRQQVDKLPTGGTINKAQLTGQIDRLERELKEAYAAARQRLVLVTDKRQRTSELVTSYEQMSQLFVTIADEALFDLSLGMESAGGQKDPQALKGSLKSPSANDAPAQGGTLSIVAEANQLYGLLREVAVLGNKELLVPSRERYIGLSQRQ